MPGLPFKVLSDAGNAVVAERPWLLRMAINGVAYQAGRFNEPDRICHGRQLRRLPHRIYHCDHRCRIPADGSRRRARVDYRFRPHPDRPRDCLCAIQISTGCRRPCSIIFDRRVAKSFAFKWSRPLGGRQPRYRRNDVAMTRFDRD